MQPYLIYDQGLKQLKHSGLVERLQQAEKLYQYVSEDDIPSFVQDIYTHHQPLTQPAKDHLVRTNKIYADPQKHSWRVFRPEDTRLAPANKEQLVLAGWPVLNVLETEEYYAHERFGFSSAAQLLATASAYVQNNTATSDKRPRRWQAIYDNKHFETEITAIKDGDLAINRLDITPYTSYAPFGERIHLRPTRAADLQSVQASDSQEPGLLVSLLRYAKQVNLDTFLTKEADVKAFTEELAQTPAYLGNFGDAGMGLGDTKLDYIHYPYPIPTEEEEVHNLHTLTTQFRTFYELRTSPDEELIFIHNNKANRAETLRIPKNEAEDFMLGLIYQAKNGLGRTSQQQLVDILHYQFSEECKAQEKKTQEIIAKRKR